MVARGRYPHKFRDDFNSQHLHQDLKQQLASHKLTTAIDSANQGLNTDLSSESFEKSASATTSDADATSSAPMNPVDLRAWLKAVAERVNMNDLPDLAKACDAIISQNSDLQNNDLQITAQSNVSNPTQIPASDEQVKRSNALMTGIGMADILTYLYQDEDALTASLLYRAVRIGLMPIDEVRQQFGENVATLVQDTLARGKLVETIEKNKKLEDHLTNNQREQLTNIYNMLIAMTNDVRGAD